MAKPVLGVLVLHISKPHPRGARRLKERAGKPLKHTYMSKDQSLLTGKNEPVVIVEIMLNSTTDDDHGAISEDSAREMIAEAFTPNGIDSRYILPKVRRAHKAK